ncbi:MAG: VWA domain-containing protein [Acidobacteriota bacterium]
MNSLTGFKQTDFIVNEDSQPEIAAFSTGDGLSVPRSFVLIIDYSGSQLPYLRTSIEAAKTLVDKLAPKDRMAIVTDDVELVVEFTQDREKLKLALDSLKQRALSSRSLGQSAQLSALLATLRELVKEEERPIILFQTDGDELYRLHPIKEDSSRPGQRVREYSFEDVYQALAHSRTTLYTIIPGIQLLGVSAEEQMKRAAQMYENQITSNGSHRPRSCRTLTSIIRSFIGLADQQFRLARVATTGGHFGIGCFDRRVG